MQSALASLDTIRSTIALPPELLGVRNLERLRLHMHWRDTRSGRAYWLLDAASAAAIMVPVSRRMNARGLEWLWIINGPVGTFCKAPRHQSSGLIAFVPEKAGPFSSATTAVILSDRLCKQTAEEQQHSIDTQEFFFEI